MPRKAPGKDHEKGIGLVRLMEMFPDDETARRWTRNDCLATRFFLPGCGSLDV